MQLGMRPVQRAIDHHLELTRLERGKGPLDFGMLHHRQLGRAGRLWWPGQGHAPLRQALVDQGLCQGGRRGRSLSLRGRTGARNALQGRWARTLMAISSRVEIDGLSI